jgi:hypothetical protein
MSETMNESPKPGTKAYVEAELAAVKAELEAMKAEKEAKKATEPIHESNEGPGSAPQAETPDQRVALYVEKGYANDEPNQIIAINGVTYILPKGKTSYVPKFVAEEYYRSRRAAQRRDETVEKMLENASKVSK